jgi:hypothetical protein
VSYTYTQSRPPVECPDGAHPARYISMRELERFVAEREADGA